MDPIAICNGNCFAYIDARFAQSVTVSLAHAHDCVTDRDAERKRLSNAIHLALTDPVILRRKSPDAR